MTRAYRHGNGRIQDRSGGGRFRHSTLADVGLACEVCESCRALNPRGLGEPAPEACHACGAVFVRERCEWSEVRDPRHAGGFLNPALFRRGAYTECGKPAVATEVGAREHRCADHVNLTRE